MTAVSTERGAGACTAEEESNPLADSEEAVEQANPLAEEAVEEENPLAEANEVRPEGRVRHCLLALRFGCLRG